MGKRSKCIRFSKTDNLYVLNKCGIMMHNLERHWHRLSVGFFRRMFSPRDPKDESLFVISEVLVLSVLRCYQCQWPPLIALSLPQIYVHARGLTQAITVVIEQANL